MRYPILLIILLLAQLPLSANMAAPHVHADSSDVHGQPGWTRNWEVLREELHFDLSHAAQDSLCDVTATYIVHGDSAVELDLIFAASQFVAGSFEFRLNGRLLPFIQIEPDSNLIQQWQAPSSLFEEFIGRQYFDETGFSYFPASLLQIRQDSLLPGEEYQLTVSYQARLALTQDADEEYKSYVLTYVLKPLRDWKGLGELHVTADLPDGFAFRSNLNDLNAENGTVESIYEGLPADHLIAEVRRPGGYIQGIFDWVNRIFNLVLIMLGIATAYYTWRDVRRGRKVMQGLGWHFLRGLVALILLAGVYAAMAFWLRDFVEMGPSDYNPNILRERSYGYGLGLIFGLIFYGPLLLLGTILLKVILHWAIFKMKTNKE